MSVPESPSTIPAPPPAYARWLVLFASMALVTVGSGSIFLMATILKPMAEGFGWSRSALSLAISFQFAGAGFGGILMGLWLDRAGVGRPALLAAVMISGGLLIASYAQASWHLYVAHGLMMGLLGQSVLYTPLVANVMKWFEGRHGAAVGLVTGGQSLGGAIWPPIFRYLNDEVGWRETYWLFGLFALATLVPLSLAIWRRPPAARPRPATPAATAPTAARTSRPAPSPLQPWHLQLLLCLAIVGCCIAMAMPLAHMVAHVSDLGFSLARGAEMLSVMLATSWLARAAGGAFIVDRWGGLIALAAFSALQAAMLGALVVVDDLVSLYIASAIFGLGYGGIGVCYPIIVREYLPANEAGRRIGIVTLFGAGGMAIGGAVAGVLFDLTGGYQTAFAVGFLFNLGNVAIVLGLLWRRRGGGLSPAYG